MTGGRRWLEAVVVVCAALAATPASAQTATQRGLDWLLAQQGPDGSFGASTGENPVLATSEAVLALRAEGMGASEQVQAAELWLSFQHPAELDLLARRLRALRGTPLQDDAGLAALRAQVLSQAASGPEAGFGPGWAWASPVELSLSLAALVPGDASSGAYVTWVPGATGACKVISLERPALMLVSLGQDGWGLVDAAPDPTTTARVASALRPFRRIPGFNAPLDAALGATVLGEQATSGAIGDGSQPVLDTAQALQALEGLDATAFSQGIGAAGTKAQLWFGGCAGQRRQLERRRLCDEPGTAGLVHPPTRLPDAPRRGRRDARCAHALCTPLRTDGHGATHIEERRGGGGASDDGAVHGGTPSAGGTPVTVAEVPVGALAPGGATEVTASFSVAHHGGLYRLVASADPDNRVPETDETDNSAEAEFRVVDAINLAVYSSDIHFQDAGGGQETVSAVVHCEGNAIATPFEVAFYDGNPASGGTVISTVSIPGVASGATKTASVAWDASMVGGPTSDPRRGRPSREAE